MKNLIRNLRVFGLIIMISVTQVAYPPKAYAFVGSGLIIAGGAGIPLLVIGGASLVGGSIIGTSSSGHGFTADFGTLLMILGLVLLDSDANANLSFAEISSIQAQEMNVSAEQAASYNKEIDRINLIREQIQSELLTSLDKGENLDFSTSHKKWEQYKVIISPEAYVVVEKISNNLVQSLRKI